MKFCSHCGAEIDDQAVICVKCGCSTSGKSINAQDAPSIGFAVLSFFFPLVGLILYLVWHTTSPLKAKSCGKGALIGVCVNVGLSILWVIFIGILWGGLLGGLLAIALPTLL